MKLYELSGSYARLQAEIEENDPDQVHQALAKIDAIEGLTANYVQECLSYDKRRGVLRWKIRPEHHFDSAIRMSNWNKRYAGKIAGSVSVCNQGGTITKRIVVFISGKLHYAHRIIFLIVTGEMPKKVDHRDMNGLNNRWTNLRAATTSQNNYNRRRYKNNTYGFKGVSKKRSRWHARIRLDGKCISLGGFATAREAHSAYCTASRRYHRKFGRTA
jgi:hypothetical protein